LLGLRPDGPQAGADLVGAARGSRSSHNQIPLDDARTYAMLSSAKRSSFPGGKGGLRQALVDMRADGSKDWIALSLSIAPGPMANIGPVILRSQAQAMTRLEYATTPRPILKDPLGVITSQSRCSRLAKDLAGYSLAQADILSRAMGRCQRERTVTQSVSYRRGRARHRQAPPTPFFDACANSAEYGFNKSHSRPYASHTYQTAVQGQPSTNSSPPR